MGSRGLLRKRCAPVPSPTLHHAPIELMSIMRGMSTRQATKWTTILLTLLAFITACSPSDQSALSPTPFSLTSTPQPNTTPTVSANTPIPTQLTCLTQPGRVESETLETTDPPQEYRIYLPPCYDELTEQRYPVLYLLHGQTYSSDQWIRIGAVDALDQLSLPGESQPFIIVFPKKQFFSVFNYYLRFLFFVFRGNFVVHSIIENDTILQDFDEGCSFMLRRSYKYIRHEFGICIRDACEKISLCSDSQFTGNKRIFNCAMRR